MRKLAMLAGVSASTVSRALRNDSRLRPDTIQRIKELAEMYQYQPVQFEPALSTEQSRVIGCIIPRVSSPFFGYILQGILEQAFQASYKVITLQTNADFLHACKALQTLVELRVAGILLCSGSSAEPIPSASLFELWSHEIHVVGMQDTPVAQSIDQIASDELQAASLVVDYLCSLGHREIAYLGPQVDILTRSKAFRHVLKHRGLSTQWFWDVHPESRLEQLLAFWKSKPAAPTAVVTYNDTIAAEFLLFAVRHGLRVPQEMSVVGFANVQPLNNYLLPPLTSVEQNPVDIGRQAFMQLLRRMTADEAPGSYRPGTTRVAANLVKRESCSHPRRNARL
jgi:DNA-binding LacI/PurR family transcriptional regulator